VLGASEWARRQGEGGDRGTLHAGPTRAARPRTCGRRHLSRSRAGGSRGDSAEGGAPLGAPTRCPWPHPSLPGTGRAPPPAAAPGSAAGRRSRPPWPRRRPRSPCRRRRRRRASECQKPAEQPRPVQSAGGVATRPPGTGSKVPPSRAAAAGGGQCRTRVRSRGEGCSRGVLRVHPTSTAGGASSCYAG
jgi:hypothetical protein